jgi:class 3 adenylate cyclase
VLAAEEDVIPPELFRTNAFAVGDISDKPDADGVLRRVPALRTYYAWNPLFRNLGRKYHKKLVQELRWVQFRDPDSGRPDLTIPIDEDGYFKLEDLTGQKTQGFSQLVPAYTVLRAWHMGILLAARELNLDLAHPTLEPGRIILRGTNGLERTIPVDAEGRLLVNWRILPNDARLLQINIERLLLQDKARSRGETTGLTNRFRNALVTVGSGATGNNITDMGTTPLSSRTLLPSTHWNVANMIITDQFIRRPTNAIELALILGLGIASAWLTWRLRSVWASVWVSTLVVGYGAVAVLLFVRYRYWLPLTFPVGGGVLLTHVCLVTYRAVFEQQEQRRVKKVFSKIVSPNVVQELLRAEKLSLGGARRKVTVFFADVRGFTELSDLHQARAEEHARKHKLSEAEAEDHFNDQARQLLETVNLYLGLIADRIKQHGGTLDKYIGDCVMAFWGAPTPNEQHALACVRTAIEVQRSIDAMNQQRAQENRQREQENLRRQALGQPPLPLLELLHVGCGINTGVVTVGLMGSDAHLVNYTVFGREVNVASRLEGVSGPGRITIGESAYAEIRRDDPALAATCIELPAVTVKGIRTPVKIFEAPWKQALQAVEPSASASAMVTSA